MSCEFKITPEKDYIHVCVSGTWTVEKATDMWQKISAACHLHNCFNVLGEQNISHGISAMDAWNHQTIFTHLGINAKYCIAWADLNPKTFEQTDFIRTVLSNRSIGYGKVFSKAADAKNWLLKKANQRQLRQVSRP